MSNTLYAIPLQTIDGRQASLENWRNNVLLVVNVASQCGLTKQYEALENLYETYRDRGFAVLGFPSTNLPGRNRAATKRSTRFVVGPSGTVPDVWQN